MFSFTSHDPERKTVLYPASPSGITGSRVTKNKKAWVKVTQHRTCTKIQKIMKTLMKHNKHIKTLSGESPVFSLSRWQTTRLDVFRSIKISSKDQIEVGYRIRCQSKKDFKKTVKLISIAASYMVPSSRLPLHLGSHAEWSRTTSWLLCK